MDFIGAFPSETRMCSSIRVALVLKYLQDPATCVRINMSFICKKDSLATASILSHKCSMVCVSLFTVFFRAQASQSKLASAGV